MLPTTSASTVNPDQAASARALGPIHERTIFGRSLLLFDGVDRDRLTALGWWGGTTVIVGLTAGFVAAAIVSLILIAVGRLERRGSVPLGAYLGAGAAIVVWAWH